MRIYDAELQKSLDTYMQAEGVSQNGMAKKLGVAVSTLSQYRAEKYNGDVARLERTIREYLASDDAIRAVQAKAASYLGVADYVPTSISTDVYKAIEYAQNTRGLVIAYGDAGIGKTKAAMEFLRKHQSTAIYLEITACTGSLGCVLKLLAKELRITSARAKMDMMLAIREKLEETNNVIIVDEAQHLKLTALEELRAMSDHGIAVCLIGNIEVYTRMMGRQEAQFAQLFSRVAMRRSYTTRKVRKEDIKALFPTLERDGKTKELDFLLGVARTKWGIRGAVNVYRNAANNEDVSYEGLYAMARHMGIGQVEAAV